MEAACDRSFCFTMHGRDALFNTAQDLSFPSQDAAMILNSLKNQIGFIPFCDYLKRYIYIKSGMVGHFREVPVKKYEQTITDAFRETGTPCAFLPVKTPLQTRVRSWLEQSVARRNVVLLLGFGLSMTVEDVNLFLTNAIHDRMLDNGDPLDAICLYCYKHGYRYSKMKQLWQLYQSGDPEKTSRSALVSLQPAGRSPSIQVAEEDYQLLNRLIDPDNSQRQSSKRLMTSKAFNALYYQAASLIGERMHGSSTPDDVARPQDIEKTLYASVPRDKHGNLVPELRSSLKKELTGKRFSRQHIYELLHEKIQPNRYDLISLQFLVFSEKTDQYPDARERFRLFTEETNSVLQSCGFGPLYTADPYECFVLMCILSVDPLGTYADVMELSYTSTQENK